MAGLGVIVGLYFAAVEAFYTRREAIAAEAHRSQAARELLDDAGRQLLAVSRYSLPLPRTISEKVPELRAQAVKARDLGADEVKCRDLVTLSNVLLLRLDGLDVDGIETGRIWALPYLSKGIALVAGGRYTEARRILTEGIAAFPRAADLLVNRARAALRARDLHAARYDAERAIEMAPSAAAHLTLGLALLAAGDLEQARWALNAATLLEPDWYEPYRALASVSLQESEFAEARRYLKEATKRAQSEPTSQLALAAVTFKLGNMAANSPEMARARDLQPSGHMSGFGYTGVVTWTSDLPMLDVFNGNFLLDFRREHPDWHLEDFRTALLKALSATLDLNEFIRFEEALYDACVAPVYFAERDQFVAQHFRLLERTPACLRRSRILVVEMAPANLRIPEDQLPRHKAPVLDPDKVETAIGGT